MSDFSGNSAKLAIESIRNAYYREHYIQITQEVADDIIQQTTQAEVLSPCQQLDIWKGAAKKAHSIRNKNLEKTRDKLSASALAFSKFLKHKAPAFSELVKRYTNRYYGNLDHCEGFSYLSSSSKMDVYRMIVASAGRTNTKVNYMSKVIGCFGAISLVTIIVLFVYGIVHAQCSVAYSLRSAVTFQTGLAGAYLGSKFGVTMAAWCRCTYAVVFVTSLSCGVILGFSAAIVGNSVVTTVFITIFTTDVSSLQLNLHL